MDNLVRYTLKDNKEHVFYQKKNESNLVNKYTEEVIIHLPKGKTAFLDILEKYSDNFWLYNIYNWDGGVYLRVYGIPHLLGDIILFNQSELYDGRFNFSVRPY